jgi:1-acyl-sn-glycerol-3-phosphate acyltransferase
MKVLISFMALSCVKLFSHMFFRLRLKWISEPKSDFENIRLVVLLNHTSLYEPIFMQAAPFSFVWQLAKKMVAPGADKTLNRPIVGFFWRLMGPGFISITRKRDKSWFKFLKMVEDKRIILIAPEGRMMRQNGMDATGRPMTVRSGIAEILNEMHDGKILIAYSGGLHHVQYPGERLPHLFKAIKLNIETLDIPQYKASFKSEGIQFRKDIVADLESRLKKNCPL